MSLEEDSKILIFLEWENRHGCHISPLSYSKELDKQYEFYKKESQRNQKWVPRVIWLEDYGKIISHRRF